MEPSKFIKNQIIPVHISIRGKYRNSVPFRIVEVSDTEVVCTPAMEENEQARANAFIKLIGGLLGETGGISEVKIPFDRTTGKQTCPTTMGFEHTIDV